MVDIKEMADAFDHMGIPIYTFDGGGFNLVNNPYEDYTEEQKEARKDAKLHLESASDKIDEALKSLSKTHSLESDQLDMCYEALTAISRKIKEIRDA